MKRKKIRETFIIGHRDRVDLPELELFGLPCKIDTGAATSAIHCRHVRVREVNGVARIIFTLLDPSHAEYNGREYSTANFQERKIKSSFGQTEYRYVITSVVVLFGKSFTTEFTLSDREKMTYPVLLGKRLLRRGFLVDVSKINLSYKAMRAANLNPPGDGASQ